ncbi:MULTISPECIES: hypothetical protein [Rhodococcus]|uniref:hypothetical protein n=1 Tax=Rhodococcus TaxID=1827 RepID=UPI0023E325FB|nr:hypothetical protein [Rhodococcus sp. T2V]MDF3312981.1 hypothetical protein [Rhodococcus sp. T2V]
MTHPSPHSTPSAVWSTAWIKHHLDRMEHSDSGTEVANMEADAAPPSLKPR